MLEFVNLEMSLPLFFQTISLDSVDLIHELSQDAGRL